MSDVRKELVSSLNRAIESDHDLIEYMLLKPKQTAILPDQPGMFSGKLTALSMMCQLQGIDQIYPYYEDDIIVRFE